MAETIILMGEERMEKTIESLKKDLSIIRTGRANPAILNNVTVDYYGVPTPINQMSSISVPEAQQLVIKPYDKSTLKNIEKAIQTADLNLTPLNDGVVIRINFPALTEARRKELAKEVKNTGENAKVAIRNIRRDVNEQLKKIEKNKEISEDDKLKSKELKLSAVENAKKYLELSPQAEDKEDVEEFIEDLLEEDKEEPTKVLKG